MTRFQSEAVLVGYSALWLVGALVLCLAYYEPGLGCLVPPDLLTLYCAALPGAPLVIAVGLNFFEWSEVSHGQR